MDVRVTTQAGGIFIVREATAFGMDAIMGYTDGDSTLRIFPLAEDDVTEVA